MLNEWSVPRELNKLFAWYWTAVSRLALHILAKLRYTCQSSTIRILNEQGKSLLEFINLFVAEAWNTFSSVSPKEPKTIPRLNLIYFVFLVLGVVLWEQNICPWESHLIRKPSEFTLNRKRKQSGLLSAELRISNANHLTRVNYCKRSKYCISYLNY